MRVLLIAGGGTLGTYTSKELLALGHEVDVIALEAPVSDHPHLKYIRQRADDAFLAGFLNENRYDAIVDFIHYPDPSVYRGRSVFLLERTKHLVFLSSYRVYADLEHPVTENSPQLLDACGDDRFLMENDHYGISKSYEERILRELPYRHWTIVRPLISFSHYRFDLITQGANTLLTRPALGKPILLPKDAADLTAGLTWAGNTGRMIARLAVNDGACGEAFTIGTGEKRTWREVAGYYTKLNHAEFVWIDSESYLEHATMNQPANRVILYYDRLYDRQIDNSKVLKYTGLNNSDLTGIEEALAYEMDIAARNPDERLERILHDAAAVEINRRMDAYLKISV